MSGNDKTPMAPSDASRIQSSQARSGNDMSITGFAARAQSAGQQNVQTGLALITDCDNKCSSGSCSADTTPKK